MVLNNADVYYLKQAFTEARKGEGRVSPNPMVGAVVVKEGKIVGRGYHEGPGYSHAEVKAIEEAGAESKSSDLYVTLEPCCHQGRTPPCTDRIIESGIKRVVAPVKDPNPMVDGKGFQLLKKKGIQVDTGIMADEAEELNKFYFKYMRDGIPYVVLKSALTVDGKIGDPKRNIYKITGDESIKRVHKWRNRVDAILVGVGTVLEDNPQLNVRLVDCKKQPVKMVIDPGLKTPEDSRIFNGESRVILISREEKEFPGAEVWAFPDYPDRIPVKEILKRAADAEITSVLVEGGGETFTNFLEEEMVDRCLLFYSGLLIGNGVSFLNRNIKEKISIFNIEKIGEDILMEGKCLRE